MNARLVRTHPDTTVCGANPRYPRQCGCGNDLPVRYITTHESPMGTTRVSNTVREDVWLDAVYAQLLVDKYLPIVVGSVDVVHDCDPSADRCFCI